MIQIIDIWHINISQRNKMQTSKWLQMRTIFINKICEKQETISLCQLVDRQIINRFCLLYIKDCKCNVNGSTGCHPSGTCLCKEDYVGSQYQHCKLDFIFKRLLIFLFYVLLLINWFYAGSVFKEIFYVPNMCILFCQFEKFSFSLGHSMFQISTLYMK